MGRGFFLPFTAWEVHEGRSFAIEPFLLWGYLFVAQAAERLDHHRQPGGSDPRARLLLFLVKHG